MSQPQTFTPQPIAPASTLETGRRARFITRTYAHLLGAVVGFVGVEVALFASGVAEPLARYMLGGSWLMILGAFLVVAWLASRTAHRTASLAGQYAALGGFVLAEAILFVPLLFVAQMQAPGTIESAALVTLLGFTGLTATVFWTRKDFQFLGGMLRWVGIGALVLIAAGLLFGFRLGTYFSVGMIVFAGAAILYDTSRVLHQYPEDRYVAAALELFASVAMMFWYVLRLFLGRE